MDFLADPAAFFEINDWLRALQKNEVTRVELGQLTGIAELFSLIKGQYREAQGLGPRSVSTAPRFARRCAQLTSSK